MTITEFMVALLISLILVAAMIQLFVRSRSTYTYEQDLARAQEGGRIASDMIARDIRMSGYFGCRYLDPAAGSIEFTPPLTPATIYTAGEATSTVAYRYTGSGGVSPASDWTPPLPAIYFPTGETLLPYSDVLMIRYATSSGASLLGPVDSESPSPISLPDTYEPDFRPNSIVMISDCKNTDVFQIDTATIVGPALLLTISNPTLGRPNSGKKYLPENTEFLSFYSRAYYVARNVQGQPALWRREIVNGGPQSQELIQGIEVVQYAFGLTPGGSPDASPQNYLTADLIGNNQWQNVRSIRIGMVVRTDNQTTSANDTLNYDVLGATDSLGAGNEFDNYTPPAGDRRQRQVYVQTVEKRKPLR